MRTVAEIEAELDDLAIWEAVGNMPYTRANKAEFDRAITEISDKYKDFRRAMVRDCKKADLPAAILGVVERTRAYLGQQLAEAQQAEVIELARQEYKQFVAEREEFMRRVAGRGQEYIAGFDSAKEGIRAWDCLVCLIEDGTVTEANIHEYGITL